MDFHLQSSQIDEYFFFCHSSVYVLIADTEAMLDFVRAMNVKELLSTGDYVIISIEDEEVYKPSKKHQFFRHVFETSIIQDDNISPLAFRALLIVAPSAPINPNYTKFQQEVNCRNKRPPFNIPSHKLIEPDVRIKHTSLFTISYDQWITFHRFQFLLD